MEMDSSRVKYNSTWRHRYEQILCFAIVKSWSNIIEFHSALLSYVFSSFTWWLQTEPRRRYGCGGWARSAGVPTTPWASWTHNLLEERWSQFRRQRRTHHSKRCHFERKHYTLFWLGLKLIINFSFIIGSSILMIFSVNCIVNKTSEHRDKCQVTSQVPRAQNDMFKMLFMSNQWAKTERYSD